MSETKNYSTELIDALDKIRNMSSGKEIVEYLDRRDSKFYKPDEWHHILKESASFMKITVTDLLECISSLHTDEPIDPDSEKYKAFIAEREAAYAEMSQIKPSDKHCDESIYPTIDDLNEWENERLDYEASMYDDAYGNCYDDPAWGV